MADGSAPAAPQVRMYRQGMGDCFLVSLPADSGKLCHMLIDCGVHCGTPGADALMRKVALDIEATTGGRLDVVVASHDHWDNLSGFIQARSVFDRIGIGEVWMPWTEDPIDRAAEALRQSRFIVLRGLRVMAKRHAQLDSSTENSVAGRLRVPLSFFGLSFRTNPRAALDYLRDHPSRPLVRYHSARGVASLPGAGEARVYFLGPSREHSVVSQDTAGRPLEAASPALAVFASSGGLPAEADQLDEFCQAFDVRYRLAPESAERMPFFRGPYLAPELEWRRICFDWMSSAEPLALSLDSQTNNQSLALAIEIEPRGRVLLFPGDSQSSQWSKWRNSDGPATVPPRLK